MSDDYPKSDKGDKMITMPKSVLFVLTVAIALIGMLLGAYVAIGTNKAKAVCHSKTEDSAITDCNYSNGAWYRK